MNAYPDGSAFDKARISLADGEPAVLGASQRFLLAANPRFSQRELLKALGLSPGKAHCVLRALLAKGLLKIQSFRRNDNKLAYAYPLTSKGMKERLTMTRASLARKEVEFEQLHTITEPSRLEMRRARPAAMASDYK